MFDTNTPHRADVHGGVYTMPLASTASAAAIRAQEMYYFEHLDWHGIALISPKEGEVELRLYDEQSWHTNWCDIHNRKFGILLFSSCRRVYAVGEKTYIFADRDATALFQLMRKELIEGEIVQWLETQKSCNPCLLDGFELTIEEVLDNDDLIARMADQFIDGEDDDLSKNQNIERAVLDTPLSFYKKGN